MRRVKWVHQRGTFNVGHINLEDPEKPHVRMPSASTLISIEHGCFDTSALQDELAQALEEDRKYKLTDSMKKRAIHTAANYDEFKNLVACADLKPISQRELQSFSKSSRQTNIAFKKKNRKSYGERLQFEENAATIDTPPNTAADFCRQWKRVLKTNEAKYKYLVLTSPATLGKLFKNDLDADLMADIIKVLLEAHRKELGDKSLSFAIGTLHALSTVSRFSLVLDFLDNNQLEHLRELFMIFQDATNDEHEHVMLTQLKKIYRM